MFLIQLQAVTIIWVAISDTILSLNYLSETVAIIVGNFAKVKIFNYLMTIPKDSVIMC